MFEIIGNQIYRTEEKYLSIQFLNIYFVDKKRHMIDMCYKTISHATVKVISKE